MSIEKRDRKKKGHSDRDSAKPIVELPTVVAVEPKKSKENMEVIEKNERTNKRPREENQLHQRKEKKREINEEINDRKAKHARRREIKEKDISRKDSRNEVHKEAESDSTRYQPSKTTALASFPDPSQVLPKDKYHNQKTDWTQASFGGDAIRRDKFLSLLGAKKSNSPPLPSSSPIPTSSSLETTSRNVLNHLETQFEQGRQQQYAQHQSRTTGLGFKKNNGW